MTVPPSERNYKPYQEYRQPGGLDLKERKALFEALNRHVGKRGGWITSIPGAKDVAMECLPGSALPDELRGMGYKVEPDGEGERLIPHAMTEAVVTEGSTKPIFRTTHAGIVAVERYRFKLP